VSSEVQGELTGLQNALLNTDSIEQFLHELAVLAVRSLGGDAAGGAPGETGAAGQPGGGAGAEMS
jgi:hypothetical protein